MKQHSNRAESIYFTFDTMFQLLSKILLSAIKRLSPYAIAILPGSIFGFTIFEFFLELSGMFWLSVIVGVSGFVALESAGIWSGHKAAEFYGDGTNRIWIPVVAFVLYLMIGIGTLWVLDGYVPNNVKIVGTSLFFLAGVVYTLFGFQSHQERMEAKEAREKRNEETKEERERREIEVSRIQEDNRRYELEEDRKDRALERQIRRKQALSGGAMNENKKVIAGKADSTNYDEQKMKKLIELLQCDPPMSKVNLAKEIDVSRPTLDRYLRIVNQNE